MLHYVDYSKVYDGTMVGHIQKMTAVIVSQVLSAAKKGRPLDDAIRRVECSELGYLSEETPMALPLMNKKGKIIGLTVVGNKYFDADEASHWESFDIITVEVPEFKNLKD